MNLKTEAGCTDIKHSLQKWVNFISNAKDILIKNYHLLSRLSLELSPVNNDHIQTTQISFSKKFNFISKIVLPR